MHVLVSDRHRLRLVFQDFHAQAIRRLNIGLVQPVVSAWQHRDAGGLPFGHLLLNTVDDETDVVDDRALRSAGARYATQVQMHKDAWEHDVFVGPDLEPLAAHADEYFLVGLHVFRGEVPMPHGRADFIERKRLRTRAPESQRRGKQNSGEQAFHESLPVKPAFSRPAAGKKAITLWRCAKA